MNAAPPRPSSKAAAWAGVLVLGSYAFRLPALLNARSTNSDAAVVGLQAMHLLRGEWSPFLWGSGYQTSADAVVAAAFFAVFGATPLVLMLSALSLHVLGTLLVFATLRRHTTDATATLLSLPMVLTTSSLHSYALYPPRQASLTLAVAAFCAIDRAATRSASPRAWLALGGALSTLAVSADPYPMLLVPLAGFFALLAAWEARGARLVAARFASYVGGALVGAVPFVLLRHAPGANPGPLGLTTTMVAHHTRLLLEECLPWAVGTKVYFAQNVMDYAPWKAPWPVHVIQAVGALCLAAIVAFALLVAPRAKALPWSTRRLGLVGGLVYPLAIAAFLVSVMVMDHFSMRYLAVLALLTPFAALPMATFLGPRRFALVLVPHLAATAIGGWVGFGPFVHGIVPVRETPELRDDYALESWLEARGIRYATADYWASYRLTLLWKERIVVVPKNPSEDRYRPYREAFAKQPVYAYIHDRGRSREDLGEEERRLRATARVIEEAHLGGHTVLVVERSANDAP